MYYDIDMEKEKRTRQSVHSILQYHNKYIILNVLNV